MELGIKRGRFQVIRVHPEAMPPDGGYVVRIEDQETPGFVVTTMLSNEDGERFAAGFHRGEENGTAGPVAVLAMPDGSPHPVPAAVPPTDAQEGPEGPPAA